MTGFIIFSKSSRLVNLSMLDGHITKDGGSGSAEIALRCENIKNVPDGRYLDDCRRIAPGLLLERKVFQVVM